MWSYMSIELLKSTIRPENQYSHSIKIGKYEFSLIYLLDNEMINYEH